MPDKEAGSANSKLLAEPADEVWCEIDKHTGLLFFLIVPYVAPWLLTGQKY